MRILGSFIIVAAVLISACSSSSARQSSTSVVLEYENEFYAVTRFANISSLETVPLVFQFLTNSDLSGTPAVKYVVNIDFAGLSGSVERSFSLTPVSEGTYFVRAFLDSNGNGVLDSGERYGAAMGTDNNGFELNEHARKTASIAVDSVAQ